MRHHLLINYAQAQEYILRLFVERDEHLFSSQQHYYTGARCGIYMRRH